MKPILVLTALAVFASQAQEQGTAQTFDLERVTNTLVFPVEVEGHPTDPTTLYVVEKAGVLKVIFDDPNSPPGSAIPQLVNNVILDISSIVDSLEHQGLLGVAMHPNFDQNRRFFIKYTEDTAQQYDLLIIKEYRMSANSDYVLDAAFTPVTIFCEITQNRIHQGGGIDFGPDGKLWAPVGDNGIPSNASNSGSPFGKILRFDVDINQGVQAQCGVFTSYIPADNPPSTGGSVPYIWDVGVRNPFSWSFDNPSLGGLGGLWFGDVGSGGQGAFEEINYSKPPVQSGKKWGAPFGEGFFPGFEQPVFAQNHVTGPNSCHSIIGGHVYRGSNIPSLRGYYVFADQCYARGNAPDFDEVVRSLKVSAPGAVSNHGNSITPNLKGPTGFGEGATGEIYMVDSADSAPFRGRLFRLVP